MRRLRLGMTAAIGIVRLSGMRSGSGASGGLFMTSTGVAIVAMDIAKATAWIS